MGRPKLRLCMLERSVETRTPDPCLQIDVSSWAVGADLGGRPSVGYRCGPPCPGVMTLNGTGDPVNQGHWTSCSVMR